VERLKHAEKAVAALCEVLDEPFSVIVRDASIQRFEFSAEAVWKAVRDWLFAYESIEEYHPRGCYRALFRLGRIDEALCVRLLDLVDDRNRTSHAYVEALAQAVFEKLPDHRDTLVQVLKVLRENHEQNAEIHQP